MPNKDNDFSREIIYYENLLKSNNENIEKVWELFRVYYKNRTGNEISITLKNIEDIFMYIKEENDVLFDDFMLFMIKVIITKIINNLNRAIDIFSKKGLEELSDDPKAIFTVFDRMIGQAETLLNLYQKLQDKLYIHSEQKENEKEKAKFNFKRIE